MAIAFPLLQLRQWVRQPPKKFPNQSLMPMVTYSSITQCHLQGCDNHAGKIPHTQQSSQRVALQPEVQTGASVCSCGLVFCSVLPQDIKFYRLFPVQQRKTQGSKPPGYILEFIFYYSMHREDNFGLHFKPACGASQAAKIFLRFFCGISAELRRAVTILQTASKS